MSYAGPASRKRTSPNIEPLASAEMSDRDGFRTPTPLRRQPRLSGRRDTVMVFAAGIALGLAIGAGAALLLAPQAGTDTRRAIVRRGRRLSRRGRDAWGDLREELSRAARRGRQAFRRRRRRAHESASD
jgi:YtxH-like protein